MFTGRSLECGQARSRGRAKGKWTCAGHLGSCGLAGCPTWDRLDDDVCVRTHRLLAFALTVTGRSGHKLKIHLSCATPNP